MRLRILVPAGLIVIHWLLFATALIWRGHPHNLHLANESLLLIIVWIADLPALAVLLAFGIEINTDLVTANSFWMLSLAVIAISLQWLLIGVVLSRFIRLNNGRRIA